MSPDERAKLRSLEEISDLGYRQVEQRFLDAEAAGQFELVRREDLEPGMVVWSYLARVKVDEHARGKAAGDENAGITRKIGLTVYQVAEGDITTVKRGGEPFTQVPSGPDIEFLVEDDKLNPGESGVRSRAEHVRHSFPNRSVPVVKPDTPAYDLIIELAGQVGDAAPTLRGQLMDMKDGIDATSGAAEEKGAGEAEKQAYIEGRKGNGGSGELSFEEQARTQRRRLATQLFGDAEALEGVVEVEGDLDAYLNGEPLDESGKASGESTAQDPWAQSEAEKPVGYGTKETGNEVEGSGATPSAEGRAKPARPTLRQRWARRPTWLGGTGGEPETGADAGKPKGAYTGGRANEVAAPVVAPEPKAQPRPEPVTMEAPKPEAGEPKYLVVMDGDQEQGSKVGGRDATQAELEEAGLGPKPASSAYGGAQTGTELESPEEFLRRTRRLTSSDAVGDQKGADPARQAYGGAGETGSGKDPYGDDIRAVPVGRAGVGAQTSEADPRPAYDGAGSTKSADEAPNQGAADPARGAYDQGAGEPDEAGPARQAYGGKSKGGSGADGPGDSARGSYNGTGEGQEPDSVRDAYGDDVRAVPVRGSDARVQTSEADPARQAYGGQGSASEAGKGQAKGGLQTDGKSAKGIDELLGPLNAGGKPAGQAYGGVESGRTFTYVIRGPAELGADLRSAIGKQGYEIQDKE